MLEEGWQVTNKVGSNNINSSREMNTLNSPTAAKNSGKDLAAR
jgi:hypothetical protein